MPELKIKCPHCDMITGTGMGLGEGSKFNPNMFQDNQTHCKTCGRMVSWDGKDVINKEDFA